MTSYVQDINVGKKVQLSDTKKEETKTLLAKKHKEDSKLVKGVFNNLEAPGGSLEFTFRMYPQDPVRKYILEDGGTYELPICVAKHINNTCNEREHKFLVDKEGRKMVGIDKKRQRYQFLSTEYM